MLSRTRKKDAFSSQEGHAPTVPARGSNDRQPYEEGFESGFISRPETIIRSLLNEVIMKQNTASIARKALSAALILSLLGSPAMAGYSSLSQDGGTPTVTVTSAKDEMVAFQVAVPNADRQDLQVVIRDADGSVIFREFVKDANYSKVFHINTTDSDKVKFEVFQGKKLILDNTFRLTRKFEEKLDVQLVAAK
jgi:hypothetical protein